jgi:hypothetical protein
MPTRSTSALPPGVDILQYIRAAAVPQPKLDSISQAAQGGLSVYQSETRQMGDAGD